MRLPRAARRLTSWIALLAVLMAALAPTISQALGTQPTASWVEVCGALGAKWVMQPDAGSTDPAPAPADAHPFAHCPYCLLHTDTLAMPVAPVVLGLLPRLSDQPPVAFLAAPRTLFAWLSAQPRAPPHRS